MKIFKTFKPKNDNIANYIQYYYLDIDTENKERQFTCFPHFNNSITLYKSHIRKQDNSVLFVKNGKAFQIFTPIREKLFTVKQIGEIYRIVIVFNPLGIQQFFKNKNFSDFIENGDFFSEVELKAIFKTINCDEITNILDKILLDKFSKYENPILAKTLDFIFSNHQDFSVELLAENLGISRRHLNRIFNSEFGLSVKKFHNIVMFRMAINKKLFEKSNETFSSIAHELYFSDQAHLNKTFSKFTLDTPKKFIEKGTYLGNEDTFWHFKL